MLGHMLDFRKRSQNKLKKSDSTCFTQGYALFQKAGYQSHYWAQNAEESQYANHKELTFMKHDYRLLSWLKRVGRVTFIQYRNVLFK